MPAGGADETQRAGRMSFVAWAPGGDIDVRDWVHAGKRLGAMTRCSQWWLGDWVRYGTGRWGEKYKEAARITGYDVKTLRNIAYVAEKVGVSRRRDNLSWSHHAELCGLEPEGQDRWLDLAVAQRMSVADLRIELRSAKRVEGRSPSPTQKTRLATSKVTCPQCHHEFMASAAGDF